MVLWPLTAVIHAAPPAVEKNAVYIEKFVE